jgi:hypothetical protein
MHSVAIITEEDGHLPKVTYGTTICVGITNYLGSKQEQRATMTVYKY